MRAAAGLCAALVIIAAVLSGCTGTKTLPVRNPEEPALLVDYQRSGGIAGLDDRLVIFDNGITLVSGRTTSRELLLSRADIDRISAVFDAAQFSALEGNYTSGRGGADLMQYSIWYRGRTVNTEDTAVPDALEPVIEELNRVLSSPASSQGDLQLPRIVP